MCFLSSWMHFFYVNPFLFGCYTWICFLLTYVCTHILIYNVCSSYTHTHFSRTPFSQFLQQQQFKWQFIFPFWLQFSFISVFIFSCLCLSFINLTLLSSPEHTLYRSRKPIVVDAIAAYYYLLHYILPSACMWEDDIVYHSSWVDIVAS